MNKIFVLYEPFNMMQKITVMNDEDNTCVYSVDCGNARLVDTVHGLCSEYNTNKVIMHGHKQILEKLQAEMSTKFTNLDIVIM